MTAMVTLKKREYLIVDELENHFNKEIVSTLIRVFMDDDTNSHEADLILPTHYVELLDLFERSDNIYVDKNINGIKIENFSDVLKRKDVKKSDVFQSGHIESTTPDYKSYVALKSTMTSSNINN